MRTYVIGAFCAMLTANSAAQAQTSLFEPTPSNPTAAAPAPAAEAAPARKPKPKRKVAAPARMLTVTNASGSSLSELEVAADGKSAKLGKELGANQTATMKLPAFKSCTVTVKASFESAGEPEQMEQNICKDRRLRLTQ